MALLSKDLIDIISQLGGAGTINQSIHEQIYGINSLGTQVSVPLSRDSYGMTFFTRPRMNLASENLRFHREFSPFLATNGDRATLAMAIRATLDPIGVWSRGDNCPLVDNRQAFIPWLTNAIQSSSGWPDISIGTYTSDEGVFHEQWAMIDDTIKQYRVWNMTNGYRDSLGSIILLLHYLWGGYGSLVFEGVMRPYYDAEIEDEIDYISRCYRFAMDESRNKITHWGSTLLFPTAIPTGSTMNFSADSPLNDEGRQHSIPYTCMGFEWNDPAVLKEFNVIVKFFNKDMEDEVREDKMKKLVRSEWPLFNYHTYFLVNTAEENTLERWVDKDYYEYINAKISRFYAPTNNDGNGLNPQGTDDPLDYAAASQPLSE
jgi:hypothetical protein